MGEGLLGPTLIHYGTPEQQARFLPPIREGTELWCQGYSEPDAGSDLANVKTRAVRDGDEWVVTGPEGLDVARPPGRLVLRRLPDRPRLGPPQGPVLSAGADGPARGRGAARSPSSPGPASSTRSSSTVPAPRVDNVVGEVGDGWRVALATLAFERGVALLGHQLGFRRELDRLVALAERERRGRATRCVRQRLAQAHIELDDHALQHAAQPLRRRRPGRAARGLHRQAVLGELAPPPRRAGHGRPRARRRPSSTGSRCPRTAATGWASSSAPSSSPGPRPSTVGRTRSSATSSASGCSACRPSRKGWREHEPRCVLRTAAAARRRRAATGCSRARSSSSPRRPGPASAPPPPGAASRRGRRSSSPTPTSGAWPRRPSSWPPRRAAPDRVHALACDVRDEAQVRRALRRRGGALRPHRRGRAQRRPRRHGAAGRDDRRAVVDRARHHPDRHLPLHPRRAAHACCRSEAGSSSTTPRCSAGGPSRARPTTRRPRPA